MRVFQKLEKKLFLIASVTEMLSNPYILDLLLE